MAGNRKTTLLGVIYDRIELGLWSSLIAGLIFFALFIAPGIPAAQRRNEAERLAQFERQCEAYCARWGVPRGTHRFSDCMSDLRQFRESIANQLASEEF